jgi:diguanylate cyclase (GGDEF)-like protein
MRWAVALALLVVCAIQAACVLTGVAGYTSLVQTLGLMTMALATYGWVLYPVVGSVTLSLLAFLSLAWSWAARPAPTLWAQMVTFGILLAAAVWQRRQRARRFQWLQQKLEDLTEEEAVKEQAIATASQAREALQKKLSRYTQLQTIAEELSNLTDLPSIAQLTVDRAFALIGKSDVCLLFLIDPDEQELSLFSSRKRESILTIQAKHGDQFDRHVLRTHRPLLVNDVRRDFRFTVSISPEREVGSVIACPLLIGQAPEGVLRLDSSKAGVYTQDDLRFLDILLDLIATAVMNAKLFAQTQHLAVTDGLTGLTLRRPFLEQLGRELTRAARSREPVSVLMVDVDHFKRYNDTYGHTAGDLVLKGVAEVLRTVVSPSGVIARYGGEEFVALLPRVARQDASDLAEKIRRVVETQVHGSARGAQQVSVSLGVAAFPDDAQAELELIRIADQRLYHAKRSGRNLVCSS